MSPIEDLVEKAAELGQPGIALTDHGNVFNAAQLFKACKKHGIRGIIGCEMYEAVPDEFILERDKPILKRKPDEGPRYHHLTIWVQDLAGWENLCALHTTSFTEDFKPYNQPLVDRAHLAAHSEGLMVGLGCLASKMNMTLTHEGPGAAYNTAKFYAETFPGRVYMELMANLPEQQAALRDQRKIAAKLGVPCIADNDVHYRDQIDGKEHGAHHILVQARAYGKKEKEEESSDRSDAGYGRYYGTDAFFLKSAQEMLETGGFQKTELEQTVELLDRVKFDFSALEEPAPPVAPIPAPGDDPEFDIFLADHSYA